MTTRATAPTRAHVIVGDGDEVRAALVRAQADGRLVRLGEVVDLGAHRVQVTADLREPLRGRARCPASRFAAGVLVVAAAGGLVWLLVVAVAALIAAVSGAVTAALAWLSAHLPLLVLGAVLLLFLICSAGSRCAGLHCRGCRG